VNSMTCQEEYQLFSRTISPILLKRLDLDVWIGSQPRSCSYNWFVHNRLQSSWEAFHAIWEAFAPWSRLTKLSRSYPNHHVLLVGFEVALRTCFPTQKPSGCEGEERHERRRSGRRRNWRERKRPKVAHATSKHSLCQESAYEPTPCVAVGPLVDIAD